MADEKSSESKDLKAVLGDVRKGKARNFALLADGSEVVGVILSKKDIGASVLIDAKKSLKARKVFTGVAHGKGADITFYATSDIPLKPAALKVWLTEATGAKIAPAFKTVADLRNIGRTGSPETAKPDANKPDPRQTDDKTTAAGKPDKKKPAEKKSEDKKSAEKISASRKKRLVAALAALLKTGGGSLRTDDKAASLVKGAKASLDKGDLDLAEKALKALLKTTRSRPGPKTQTPV